MELNSAQYTNIQWTCCLLGHKNEPCLIPEDLIEMNDAYLNILDYCFNIKVVMNMDKYYVCKTCLEKLREAFTFKKQIIQSQNILLNIVNFTELQEQTSSVKLLEVKNEDLIIGVGDQLVYFESVTMDNQDDDDSDSKHLYEDLNSFVNVDNENIKEEPSLKEEELDKHIKIKKRKKIKKKKSLISSKKKKKIKEEVCDSALLAGSDQYNEHSQELIPEIAVKRRKRTLRKGKQKPESKPPNPRKAPNPRKPPNPRNLPYKLDKNTLVCPVCQIKYLIYRDLQRHMSTHYPGYICHVCGRICVNEFSLKIHQACHKEPTYKCDGCEKMFKTKANLKQHADIVHRGLKKIFKCFHCKEPFATYYLRVKHMIDKHGMEGKKFKCHLCPRKYDIVNHLKEHVRKLHEKLRPYCCDKCDFTGFTKYALRQHNISHTGERSFQCEECLKTFGRRHTLKEHLKIHKTHKDHNCPVCGRTFTLKSTLKTHLKMHEKDTHEKDNLNLYELNPVVPVDNHRMMLTNTVQNISL